MLRENRGTIHQPRAPIRGDSTQLPSAPPSTSRPPVARSSGTPRPHSEGQVQQGAADRPRSDRWKRGGRPDAGANGSPGVFRSDVPRSAADNRRKRLEPTRPMPPRSIRAAAPRGDAAPQTRHSTAGLPWLGIRETASARNTFHAIASVRLSSRGKPGQTFSASLSRAGETGKLPFAEAVLHETG